MNSSPAKRREFPALFMTVLFVGAAIASTGCLRKMADQPLASRSFTNDVQFERRTPETQLAQQETTVKSKWPSVHH